MLPILVLRNLLIFLSSVVLSKLLLRDLAGLIVKVLFHVFGFEIAGFWLQKLVIRNVVFGLGQLFRVGREVLLVVLHESEVLEWHLLRWGFCLRYHFGFRLDVLFLGFTLLLHRSRFCGRGPRRLLVLFDDDDTSFFLNLIEKLLSM